MQAQETTRTTLVSMSAAMRDALSDPKKNLRVCSTEHKFGRTFEVFYVENGNNVPLTLNLSGSFPILGNPRTKWADVHLMLKIDSTIQSFCSIIESAIREKLSMHPAVQTGDIIKSAIYNLDDVLIGSKQPYVNIDIPFRKVGSQIDDGEKPKCKITIERATPGTELKYKNFNDCIRPFDVLTMADVDCSRVSLTDKGLKHSYKAISLTIENGKELSKEWF